MNLSGMSRLSRSVPVDHSFRCRGPSWEWCVGSMDSAAPPNIKEAPRRGRWLLGDDAHVVNSGDQERRSWDQPRKTANRASTKNQMKRELNGSAQRIRAA